MRRFALLVVAGGLALVACLTFAWYMVERPTVLRVAVVRDSADQAIFTAANDAFGRAHETLRIRALPVDSLADSSAALEDGRADLAIVRGDVSLPASGQTVLIMRHNAGILVAPAGSSIRAVENLGGRTIGILRGIGTAGEANQAVLAAILAQYDLGAAEVTTRDVAPADLTRALTSHDIDAVLMVGVPGTKLLVDAVASVQTAGAGAPIFIPVPEASGIAQRSPGFETADVVRGVFGGAAPKPAATFETLGMATRLVARDTLATDVVSTLTKLLLAARPTLAKEVPLAASIAAPEADKGAAWPVHPGALAYLGDDEQTFFEKYSDAIYIGAMLLSVLGSAAAALAGRFNRGKSVDVDGHFARLHALVEDVRHARDLEELGRLEAEVDALLAVLLGPRAIGLLDPGRVAAVGVILDYLRGAVADRRAALVATPHVPFEPRVVGEVPAE